MESTVRDLHCYVIQSNSSHLGGTSVVQPADTVHLNIVNVKGGENSCILTSSLDIQALRLFQFNNGFDNKRFKPLPAGFDIPKTRKDRRP